MGRHGKNQTASAVYSYHEKRKNIATSGYGSKSVRLGKDSLQDFDCCALSLQPCRQPVVTPQGYLFEREAILESLLHQKRENARKMKEYEKQRKKRETELEELAKAEARDRLEKFVSS
ncbi:nitric oxide synthase-interacting protein-like, partial [Gigantopelta aegis]|uniref:nitric oxide synthase-interacting protein-like n=1 Tax=Gigantopelta aegis TaxID=1735272 RepID=UPI001B88AF6C